MTLACVLGCAATTLSAEEVAFYRDVRPWGFILFRRNVESPDQLRALTEALRAAADRPDAPVMIDQEGGRVQRLGPPHWRRYPPARTYGAMAMDDCRRRDLVRIAGRLIADDLIALGINIDCAPVLDVPVVGAHDVIGDRAFGETPAEVAALARVMAEGLMAGGVLPVIKHIPGHGRARVDSHLHLPIVEAGLADLEAWDFAPFRALADMPIAMTAHVVYQALDAGSPCTTSSRVIAEIIRGAIGFDGLLLSDDLSMKALDGTLTDLTRSALTAGCDIALHCNGDLAEMRAVAAGATSLTALAQTRADAAISRLAKPEPWDRIEAMATFDAMLADLSPA